MENEIKKSKLFRNITSIVLIICLLFPLIHKLTHHHYHEACFAKNVNHFHTDSKQCFICNYEFTLFSSEIGKTVLLKDIYPGIYLASYSFLYSASAIKYSFLLRAPPVI